MSADFLDDATERELMDTASAVQAARMTCAYIPEGDPGECCWCGYVKQRIVAGACASCRDKYKLD